MKRPRNHKALNFERLEGRALLAGVVQVDVSGDGDLMIVGDDNPNVLAVQAVPGQGTFAIVPDGQTALNDLAPGTALTVSGVRRDVQMRLGDGDDRVSFSGLPTTRLRRLLAETGSGDDRLALGQLLISEGIEGSNDQGNDSIILERISTGSIAIDSAGGTVQARAVIGTEHFSLNFAKIPPVRNGSRQAIESSVVIQSSQFGSVSVTSLGRHDFAMIDSTVEGSAESKHKKWLDIESFSWGVTNSTLGRIDIQAEGLVDLNVADSKLTSGLTLRQIAGLSTPEATTPSNSARIERTDSTGPVRLFFGTGGETGAAGSAQVVINDFQVPPQADKASPLLIIRSGASLEAQLRDLRIGGDVLLESDGEVQLDASRVHGDGSVRLTASGGTVEARGLNFEEIKVTYTENDSKAKRSMEDDPTQDRQVLTISNSAFGKISVTSLRSLVDMRLTDSTAQSMRVRFDDSSAEAGAMSAGSRVSLERSRIDGPLAVTTRNQPLELRLDQARVGRLSVTSVDAPLSLDVDGTEVRRGLRVASRGDAEDFIRIARSHVRGRSTISLDQGSDEVRIHDSIFQDPTFLDGGAGDGFHDVLLLCNSRFHKARILRSWEEVLDACAAGQS